MAASLVFVTVSYGSFIEPQIITVTRRHIDLGVHQPLSIVVLSDMHVGPYKGAAFIRRVVRRVNALLPDLILIDGDFVLGDGIHAEQLEALAPLQDLHASIGTYAILGNHDHGTYRRLLGAERSPSTDQSEYLAAALRSLGIDVLQNAHEVVSLGTERIAIAGVDDRTSGKENLDAALAGIDPALPVILLAHSPDVILDTLSTRANLITTGHTHGGQIRLPFLGPLSDLPTHLGRKYDQGVFPIDADTTLAITRGVGESGPRARLFAWPEILLLTTGPAEDGSPGEK